MRISSARLLSGVTSLVLAATVAVVPAMAGSASASAKICAKDSVIYKTPEKGRTVWIPTNVFDIWQVGGTQTRSLSEGESTATGKSSSHSVGAEAGGDIKLVKVSGKYNYTWGRNSTVTVTWTRSYSYSLDLPEGKKARSRLYRKGYKFPVKQTVTYTNGCPNKVYWHTAIMPAKGSSSSNWLWAVETYANRGKLKY